MVLVAFELVGGNLALFALGSMLGRTRRFVRRWSLVGFVPMGSFRGLSMFVFRGSPVFFPMTGIAMLIFYGMSLFPVTRTRMFIPMPTAVSLAAVFHHDLEKSETRYEKHET